MADLDYVRASLRALENYGLQQLLDASMAMEKAEIEQDQVAYDASLRGYSKWLTILSQIECLVRLIETE